MVEKHKKNNIMQIFSYLNNYVMAINNSKLFAGIMIILLNISSKFVTFKLSKTLESYLKYTFSRNVLIYAIAWMGTRDIYIAFIIMSLCILVIDYLLNENSSFCCLADNFTDYHISLLENNEIVSDEDLKKAYETIERAKKQKQNNKNKDESDQYNLYSNYK